MKNRAGIIGKLSALICCIIFLSACVSFHSFAAGSASADVSDAGSTIYVAGNPDLYPIEYYDESSKQYLGLMPDLYQLLSQKTGYAFAYINTGKTGGQERMAKNGQAEIISAYLEGDIDPQYLKNPLYISVMKADGEERKVTIAFSEIASEKLMDDIGQALEEITADQKLTLVTSHTAVNGNNRNYILWICILSGILLFFVIAALILFCQLHGKAKKNRKNTMIDPRYGIGNDQYYVYCFQNLISDKSKALYYMAYIAFDEETFNRKYGEPESKSVQHYTAEFLNSKTGAVEYLALINDGVYALLYQSANKEDAKKRIIDIMRELDLYLANMKSDYAALFHAGVCALEENMDCTAESAFYNAKQGYLQALNSKQAFAFGTKTLVEEAHRKERLRQRIIQAIADHEFTIYLQFIVDRKGKMFGAEAVSRWQNPKEGLLSPSEYITMINHSEVITMHDLYIFSLVCKQLETWKNNNKGDLHISCNFTRYSITSSDFPDRIREIAGKYDFNYNKLIIEITEDSLSYNTRALKENIKKCKELGFLIALDDIGSGYSSLSDLYHYPIDFVKVEREIVLNAMEARGKMLLDGLVHLAHSMNIKVLCEGVETQTQNDIITSTGCDYIQGFLYSRTLPVKEAEKILNI